MRAKSKVSSPLDRQVEGDAERTVLLAVVVHAVFEGVAPVGDLGQVGANLPLGVGAQLGDERLELVEAVLVQHARQAARANLQGPELGLQIAELLVGHPHVGEDQGEQVVLQLALATARTGGMRSPSW